MHEAQQTNEMPIDDRLAQPAPLLHQIPSGKQSSGGTTPKSLFFEVTATTTPAGEWSLAGRSSGSFHKAKRVDRQAFTPFGWGLDGLE